MNDMLEWFVGRLPDEWFDGTPDVTVDREEILVVGRLRASEGEGGTAASSSTATAEGRISRFREDTRRARMRIADEAQARYGRKVAWGASYGEVSVVFTNLSVPVMTRLRQPERLVLDTLVASGVARSRSEALAWCVRLVGRNEDAWIARLRDALQAVEQARSEGPDSDRSQGRG